MKIKSGFWMAPLTLSFLAAWGGACFAQTSIAGAPQSGRAEVQNSRQQELLVAAVLPKSTDDLDSQDSDSNAVSAESTASEAAQPPTKEAGVTAFSRVGIGVKVSTLGVGIEAATPLAGKIQPAQRIQHVPVQPGLHQ